MWGETEILNRVKSEGLTDKVSMFPGHSRLEVLIEYNWCLLTIARKKNMRKDLK